MIITDREGSEDPSERIWSGARARIATFTPCRMTSTSCVITWEMTGRTGGAASRPSSKKYPSSKARSRRSDTKPGNPAQTGADAGGRRGRPRGFRSTGRPRGQKRKSNVERPGEPDTSARRESAGTAGQPRRRPRSLARTASDRHWLRSPRRRSGSSWRRPSSSAAAQLVWLWRRGRRSRGWKIPASRRRRSRRPPNTGAAVWELLRIFSSSMAEPLRLAAGRCLRGSGFWTSSSPRKSRRSSGRGYTVKWNARRRYPALRAAIPISVSFDVPFLDDEPGVQPGNLEWSHRVVGTRRATLEEFSPWVAGAGTLNSQSCRATLRPTARIAWSCRPG